MSTSSKNVAKAPKKTRNLPYADVELDFLARNVNKSWIANPQITLIWLAQADFEICINQYSTILNEFKISTGIRPQITMKLKQMDKEINKSVERIKVYLANKYSKEEAPMYYASFGMIKSFDRYKLPVDRNKRKVSLKNLIDALPVHGFENNDCGLVYWTGIYNDYELLMSQAIEIDASISKKSGEKNKLKPEIRTALNALINLIKGNYPKTYKSVLRLWGFQKEKY
jgi:hypothetical protein